MGIHVFVDTNIFLNFFHYSKEDLDALAKVFASHEHGAATVHLTQQVVDEYYRNREVKIQDALKRFKDSSSPIQLPTFFRGYPEFKKLQHLSGAIQEAKTAVQTKALQDIAASQLQADHLFKDIFQNSKIIPIDEATYKVAKMRVDLGNPPGKNQSMGDAINWTLLLSNVPNKEDIHIISEDGDFFSKIDENAPNPFLVNEWASSKNSSVSVYRTISKFLKANFDGVAFTYDKNKEALIEALRTSGSFATTHNIIADLEKFSYFSLQEAERLLRIALNNNQVGWIITDLDVYMFYRRVCYSRIGEISDHELIEFLLTNFDDPDLDKILAELV